MLIFKETFKADLPLSTELQNSRTRASSKRKQSKLLFRLFLYTLAESGDLILILFDDPKKDSRKNNSKRNVLETKLKANIQKHPNSSKVSLQLQEYFSGKRFKFGNIVKLLWGTEFQRKVWKYLVSIPYGTTRSYSDVASAIKYPLAIRAVASAVASNPMSIIFPCHRVIRKDSRIGEYQCGSLAKKSLIVFERESRTSRSNATTGHKK